MRRFACWLIFICFAVTNVAAQQIVSSDTTNYTSYSAIDYVALMRELERASRPTFWQRMMGLLSKDEQSQADKSFKIDGSIGVGYTQETNAMFVATAMAQYLLRDDLPYSYTSLTGMFSVNGSYRVRAIGGLNFSNQDRLEYNLGGGEMPVRFWGLGYAMADQAERSKYTRGNFDAEVRYVRKVADRLSLGAGLDFVYIEASDVEPLAQEYLLAAGVSERKVTMAGVNIMAEYDARRYKEQLIRGYYVKLQGGFYPEIISNQSYNLWHLEATADYYQPLWSGAMAAVDIYADLRSSHTPWLLWAKAGGENRMRGYYYGRYIDRNMITAQVELRQQIYGPISGVVWGGAGSLFTSFNQIEIKEVLPNYGVGVRFAAGGGMSLRVDYGFGRHSNGLVIHVNEAF